MDTDNEEVAMRESKRRERQAGNGFSLYECGISGRLASEDNRGIAHRKSTPLMR